MPLPKIIVLVSGNGSNLQALLDASNDGSLKAKIVLVVSNKSTAYGLERAKNSNVDTLVFTPKSFKDEYGTQDSRWRREYDVALANAIKSKCPDAKLMVLAGWMHILSQDFLSTIEIPVINLHPSLPNGFIGTNAIQRAYDAFKKGELPQGKTGCMIHDVIPEVDMGRVICTKEIFIEPKETLEEFGARMHKLEHECIVLGTRIRLEELSHGTS